MRESTKTALSVLVVIVLAGAFWLLLLAPKRDKANELSEQASALQSSVATEQASAEAAVTAKSEFPELYRQLILLGKAVPGEAATPSLIVQLNGVGKRAKTEFNAIQLNQGQGGEEEATALPGEAVSQLPIGAAVGPSGLPTMPYQLEFVGGFFQIANFIHGVESLVKTENGEVDADGRLVTIDHFTLIPAEEPGEGGSTDLLKATLHVSTYVAPADQGVTAGATATGPEAEAIEAEAAP